MVDYKNKYLKYKNKGKFIQPSDKQIESWLRVNGIEYKDFGDQFRVCNPDGDTKFCMEISKSMAVVHDFRPNHQQYDGSFLKFVSKYKDISFQEAVEEVCGKNVKYSSNNLKEEDEDDDVENVIELPNGCKSLRDKDKSKLWIINMSYLVRERGIDKDIVYKSNIHYLGTTIVVPYYMYGMIVFYQCRRQMDKIFEFPKANVTSKKAGDFLYGFDNVEPCSEVYVVESIFNALSIGDGTVATGGAKLKEGQIKLLKALNPKSVVLAADNDKAGRESVIKDYLSLRKIAKGDLFREIYYSLPPFSKDEDEQEDWNDMKQKGVDVRSYILNNKIKMSYRDVFDGIEFKSFKY